MFKTPCATVLLLEIDVKKVCATFVSGVNNCESVYLLVTRLGLMPCSAWSKKKKPFDPLSYTIRRSSGKRSTAAGMSRAMGKISEDETTSRTAQEDVCLATEVVTNQDDARVNRQSVTSHGATSSSGIENRLGPDICQDTHDQGDSKGNEDVGQHTSGQHERRNCHTTESRSQNKSPPRSARADSIPKKIRSPDLPVIQVGLVSLFDGIGSVLPTFISRLQAYPKVFIAAECEEELRQLVSAHTGLQRNGKWTKLEGGTYGIYVDDVRKLLFNDCFILKEAAVLGKGCKCAFTNLHDCSNSNNIIIQKSIIDGVKL